MIPNSITLLLLFGLLVINGISANIRCLQCTSETDENCAEGDVFPRECPSDNAFCYSRLVGGHVDRGCMTNIADCTVDSNCSVCVQDGCNKVFWPKCHQCQAGDAGCADEQVDAPTFCAQSGDFCYARFYNGQVTRGCRSEDPDCLFEPQNCHMCYRDGCNGLALAALKPTKCQQCVGSDRACLEGNSTALSTECDVLADSCVSVVTSITSSGEVLRVCSGRLSTWMRQCGKPTLCTVCQGDNCNDKRRLRCHQCKVTSLDNSCEDEQDWSAMYCTNFREDDLCYTRTFNGFFERGCLSDFDANVCNETGVDKCQLCDDIGCNSQKNSVSASSVSFLPKTLFLILIVLFKMF